MIHVKDSNTLFLQFNVSVLDRNINKLERIFGYGNPELFGALNGKVQVYIDGTFRIVPNSFYQCLIVMVFDVQAEIYVPVTYVLMTSKTESLYWHALP